MKVLCKRAIAYCFNHIMIDFILPVLYWTHHYGNITHIIVVPYHPCSTLVKNGKLANLLFELCGYFLPQFTIVLDTLYKPKNLQLSDSFMFVNLSEFKKENKSCINNSHTESFFDKMSALISGSFAPVFNQQFVPEKLVVPKQRPNLLVHICRTNEVISRGTLNIDPKDYNVETAENRKKKIINQEEYFECLQNYCQDNNLIFKKITFDEMKIPDKIDLLLQTKILIGIHGGGLANQIFMRENTHIIELFCGNYFSNMFSRLEKFSQVKNYRLNCTKNSISDGRDYNVELTVNISQLHELLFKIV